MTTQSKSSPTWVEPLNHPSFSSTRWFPFLWWIPACLGALTILSTPWPPMLDWPLHIAQGVQLAHWGDPTFLPTGVYCRSSFSSYHLFHYLASGFYSLVGPHWVSRICLLFLFVLYHATVWFLLRVYQAETRLIAVATPAFFGYLYLMGFASFFLGIPCFLLTLSVAQLWHRNPSWRWSLLLFTCLLTTFLVHLMVFYLALVCLGLRWCTEWVWFPSTRWRMVAVLGIPGILGLFRIFSLGSFFQIQNQFWNTLKQQNPDLPWLIREPSWLQKLGHIPYFLLGNEHLAWRDVMLGILLLGMVIGLLLLRIYDRHQQQAPAAWGLWSLAFTPLLFYFVLKQYAANVNFVYGRFLLPSYLMFLVLIPSMKTHRRGNTLIRLGGLVSLTFLSLNFFYHQEWTQSLEGLHQVISRIPKNSRVLGVLSHYKHAPSIVQTYRGGETRLSFSYYRHMPIVDCRPLQQVDTWPISLDVRKFDPQHMKWDYLLLYLSTPSHVFRFHHPWLFTPQPLYQPMFRAGSWLLVQSTPSLQPSDRPTLSRPLNPSLSGRAVYPTTNPTINPKPTLQR